MIGLRSAWFALWIGLGPLTNAFAFAFASDPITVEVADGLPEKWSWLSPTPEFAETYPSGSLAFVRLPAKYNARGVELDRKGPILLRAATTFRAEAGPTRLLLRSRGAARLIVDGKVVAETKAISRNSSGHEAVPPEHPPLAPGLHPLPPSGQERIVPWASDGEAHRVEVWAMVGGKGLRNETGELLVAVFPEKGIPTLIGDPVPLTESDWLRFQSDELARLDAFDAASRRKALANDAEYWNRRHAIAKRIAEELPEKAPPGDGNLVDRHLTDAGPAVDDAAFLRRLSLDAAGLIPTAEEVKAFLADSSPDKRTRAVRKALDGPQWADSWMGYWQDVLAENPGLLKPTLNNSGPFRKFLRNAIEDDLPMDRFVTELVRMEGSPLGGGPAGFGMATQNDAPMAAKAHVLAKAFLAADLKCARCHDAPFHPFGQEDLFGLAALLANKPQVIPPTSTVKRQPGGRTPRVTVSIEAGASVAPEWNLGDIAPEDLPEGVLTAKAAPREKLAALLTSPTNGRFARVLVNRVWARYMGFGLVEPVDDWDGDVKTRRPELLDDLARDFVAHGYDLKRLSALILNSKAYQAEAGDVRSGLASTPARRRMSAEQILDSLFAAVGKPFRAEELCIDIDGRRPPSEFLNLGRPTRAWQLALPSNERDRPALALPVVSSLTDLMQTFGWRAARPDPITNREEATTAIQPASLANGLVVDARIARLSDDSAVTELCLSSKDLPTLIDEVVLRVLSRKATKAEVERFSDYLGDAFAKRVVPGAKKKPPMRESSRRVSWSNHLHPEATLVQQEAERIVREGDPATERLAREFRERMEDVLWALVNSPEFVFIP